MPALCATWSSGARTTFPAFEVDEAANGRRADSIPGILELAVLDIQLGDEVARLNGYVHTLQAREDSQESEFINIIICGSGRCTEDGSAAALYGRHHRVIPSVYPRSISG
ncbi:MAG: hypothetical protein OQL08_06295 [Gammaproteobacteria bacterium]|nr:hypothetical protein [Gammaproteobacteria bacterium]